MRDHGGCQHLLLAWSLQVLRHAGWDLAEPAVTDICWEEIDVRTPKWLLASLLAVGVSFAGAQPAQAEPLTPLNPAELQYLEQLHRVLPLSHDPIAFRSDGELLNRGRYVCRQRDQGVVGQAATLESPAITQLAFIYLCPQ
jgi:hypothetical protein